MKNLISVLIKQHLNLRDKVGIIIALSNRDDIAVNDIKKVLDVFISDLQEHLALENDKFYKELLMSMEKAAQDINKTKMFIKEMQDIEKLVLDFYKEYNTEQKIIDDIDNFKIKFNTIADILVLRMETEEAGVYGYWGLF